MKLTGQVSSIDLWYIMDVRLVERFIRLSLQGDLYG